MKSLTKWEMYSRTCLENMLCIAVQKASVPLFMELFSMYV